MTPDPYTVVRNRVTNRLHDAFEEILSTFGADIDLDYVDELVWDQWGCNVGLEWAQYARENIKEEA